MSLPLARTQREEDAAAIRDLIGTWSPVADEDDNGPRAETGSLSRGGRLNHGKTPLERERDARHAALRQTGDLHVIEGVHFARGPGDPRYLVCACGWSMQDGETDDAMGRAFSAHVRASRPSRSGPVERVAPAAGEDDDADERDSDAA